MKMIYGVYDGVLVSGWIGTDLSAYVLAGVDVTTRQPALVEVTAAGVRRLGGTQWP